MPRIDPQKLLSCLHVLLGPNGGIRSEEEVNRIAGLMGKFSKKLVSKCIYIQILKCSNTELLGQFMGVQGWPLIHTWLTEGIGTQNWPLVQEILELLLLCPVDVQRLKSNTNPKLVKGLSRDGGNEGVRILATKLVEQWLKIVKGETTVPFIANSSAPVLKQTESSITDIESQASYDESVEDDPGVFYETSPKKYKLVPRDSMKRDTEMAEDPERVNGLVFKITVKDGAQYLSKVEPRRKLSISSSIEASKDDYHKNVGISNDLEERTDSPILCVRNDKAPLRTYGASKKLTTRDKDKNTDTEKEKDKERDREKDREKDKDKERDKDKDRSVKDRDKDRERDKHKKSSSSSRSSSSSKDRDRHRSSSTSKHSSSSSSRDKDKDRHRSSRDSKDKDKEREKDRDNKERSSRSSRDSDRDRKDRDRKREKEEDAMSQADKDKETLSKVAATPLEKIGKIPKKPRDENATTILPITSTKKSSISIEARKDPENRPKTVKTFNSQFRSHGLTEEAPPPPSRKTLKKPASGSTMPPPSSSGGSATISSSLKRRSLSPPPLQAAAPLEKRIKTDALLTTLDRVEKPGGIKLIAPPKQTPILVESDMFMDALSASASANKKDISRKRKRLTSKDSADDKAEPISPKTVKQQAPTLKFYKDTLDETPDRDAKSDDVNSPDNSNSENNAKSEAADDSTEVDDKAIPDSAESPKSDDLPATNAEDEDTLPVKKEPGIGCGPDGPPGVLMTYKRKGPKKQLKWRETLEDVRFFELDENERVNVTKTFVDLRQNDRCNERDAFLNGRKMSPDDTMTETTKYTKLIIVENVPPHPEGSNSQEKQVQLDRQATILKSLYFNRISIPDSPAEPDPEPASLTPHEVRVIPLDDVTGNPDAINDLTTSDWPMPRGSPPYDGGGSDPSVPYNLGGPGSMGFNQPQQPFMPPWNSMNGPPAGFDGPPIGFGGPINDMGGNGMPIGGGMLNNMNGMRPPGGMGQPPGPIMNGPPPMFGQNFNNGPNMMPPFNNNMNNGNNFNNNGPNNPMFGGPPRGMMGGMPPDGPWFPRNGPPGPNGGGHWRSQMQPNMNMGGGGGPSGGPGPGPGPGMMNIRGPNWRGGPGPGPGQNNVRICNMHQKGYCKKGNKCNFVHIF